MMMMGSCNVMLEDFVKVGWLMVEGKIIVDMMFYCYLFVMLVEIYECDVINNCELIKGVIIFW